MRAFKWGVLALLAGAGVAGAAPAAEVTVTVTGVQAQGGKVLVSLQTADEFLKPEGHLGSYVAGDVAGDKTVVVRDVPPGEYAVMVLHDADGDWRMAREAGGMPLEGWAMSGQWPTGRKPVFGEVRIVVPATGAAVTLPMTYPR